MGAIPEKAFVDAVSESTSPLIDERMRAGLVVLWRAYLCSQDTGANVWDLSVPAARLYQAGMNSDHLRWLITEGLAQHGQETTAHGDPHRSFRHGNRYFLTDRSCLILTVSGAALTEDVFRETAVSPHVTLPVPSPVAAAASRHIDYGRMATAEKPQWDPVRRELTLAGIVVKRFRVPARNQETILSAFEEDDWVEHIHDPLPVTLNIDAPTRLHDTINRLNRCQVNHLLRFHGDGKGTGIFWALCRPEI